MSPADVESDLHAALDALVPEPPAGPSLFDRVGAGVARRRARRTGVLCGLAVLVLAGGVGVVIRGTPATDADLPAGPPGTPANRAAADAAQRADAFVLPAPAVRQRVPPPGSDHMAGLMTTAGPRPHTSVATRWWTMSASPTTLQADLDGYLPAGSTAEGSAAGTGSFDRMYNWPDQAGVLVGRQLIVQVDTTRQPMLVRVDAETTWIPARPASALVPAVTSAITVSLQTTSPGSGSAGVPATFGPVTDRARVDQVVALVNRVPMAVVPEGAVNCPGDTGGTMEVTFTGPTGIVTARLRLTLSGCPSNQLEMPDGTTAELAGEGNTDLGTEIRGLLGLN